MEDALVSYIMNPRINNYSCTLFLYQCEKSLWILSPDSRVFLQVFQIPSFCQTQQYAKQWPIKREVRGCLCFFPLLVGFLISSTSLLKILVLINWCLFWYLD